jgi:Holliday junction resolvase RusA-like endonuclease
VTAEAISFVVPGNPVPKARPRTVVTPKGKRRTYTPGTTAQYEERVKAFALQVVKGAGWLLADATSRFDVLVRLRFADRRRRDSDNCFKAIADAMNEIVYADDFQIVSHTVLRVLGCPDPSTQVVVRRTKEPTP